MLYNDQNGRPRADQIKKPQTTAITNQKAIRSLLIAVPPQQRDQAELDYQDSVPGGLGYSVQRTFTILRLLKIRVGVPARWFLFATLKAGKAMIFVPVSNLLAPRRK
jgi:hypothetical protein